MTDQGQQPASSQSARHPLCSQCTQKVSIYTCPSCSSRTCSLPCATLHKKTKPCSGKRNRIQHIPMNQYSWGSLMQDYTYLEQVNRALNYARSTDHKIPREGLQVKKTGWPASNRIVDKAAKEGVKLILMADHMSRRKSNSTSYKHPKPHLLWTVEFNFKFAPDPIDSSSKHPSFSSSTPTTTALLHNISSATLFTTLFTQALRKKKLNLPNDEFRQDLLHSIADVQQQQPNDSFQKLQDMAVLVLFIDPITKLYENQDEVRHLTMETLHPPVKQYHLLRLEKDKSLGEVLKGSAIVEWPVIEVWPLSYWEQQIARDQVQLVDKKILSDPQVNGDSGSGPRKTDSGWGNKRRKLEQEHNALTEAKKFVAADTGHGGLLVDYCSDVEAGDEE